MESITCEVAFGLRGGRKQRFLLFFPVEQGNPVLVDMTRSLGPPREPLPRDTSWPPGPTGDRQQALYARPQERSRAGAAPKEQPPRKLSGKRTAGARALWKAAGDRPLTEGVSPLPHPTLPRSRGG